MPPLLVATTTIHLVNNEFQLENFRSQICSSGVEFNCADNGNVESLPLCST